MGRLRRAATAVYSKYCINRNVSDNFNVVKVSEPSFSLNKFHIAMSAQRFAGRLREGFASWSSV